MTTVSSLVKYISEPTAGTLTYVFTYTKSGASDTFNVATGTPIKSILFVKAQLDTGADDPCTVSGTTITFVTGTGAGRMFVVGKG